MDKRPLHNYLNQLKDLHPDKFTLIESIQDVFETTIDSITDEQRKALKYHPMQFIDRVHQDDGEWTTNLHIWAEHGVPEIIELDPMILAHKNGYGDSILMSLVIGATGTHTEVINYKLIQRILETELDYEDIERNTEGETKTQCNVLDIEDLNGESVLDYLLDYAYATGRYEGQEPDEKLQMLLKYFAEYEDSVPEEEEVDEPEVEIIEYDKPENELQEDNDDLDIKTHVSPNASSIISSTTD